jgi:hypothetical protein
MPLDEHKHSDVYEMQRMFAQLLRNPVVVTQSLASYIIESCQISSAAKSEWRQVADFSSQAQKRSRRSPHAAMPLYLMRQSFVPDKSWNFEKKI